MNAVWHSPGLVDLQDKRGYGGAPNQRYRWVMAGHGDPALQWVGESALTKREINGMNAVWRSPPTKRWGTETPHYNGDVYNGREIIPKFTMKSIV